MAKAEAYYNKCKKRLDQDKDQRIDSICYLADHILMGFCILAESIRNVEEENDDLDVKK